MKKLAFILFILVSTNAQAQLFGKIFSGYDEIGFNFGTSYYIGDLNPYQHFENNKALFGITYKWSPTPRHTLRMYALRTQLEAYDSDNKDINLVNRNLHFKTTLMEYGAALEINFYEYMIGSKHDNFTPFLYGGLAYMSFNPMAEFEGVWYELNPLHTEGQGSVLMEEPYKLNQIVMPIGVGIKCNLFGRLALNVEYGVRKTFTDYLDDVSTEYANENLLREDNGILAVSLADRSLVQILPDGTNEGTARGNPNNNDWYFLTQVSLAVRLGPPNLGCFK
ncbi:MAG: DUF6089 family protein [Bacteroidota bacterium]